MSTNIGLTYNNPGNLTVTKVGSIVYPNQTGTYASPNGLVYATFGDAADGSNALVSKIGNDIGTDPATSLSTLGQFLGYYLNGSTDGISNTANNPNAVGYANGVASQLGIGLDQPFTPAQVNDPSFLQSLGAAITKQEGTSSIYMPSSSGVGSTIAQAVISGAQIDPSSWMGGAIQSVGGGVDAVASPVVSAGTAVAGAAGDVASSVKQAVTDALNSSVNTVTGKVSAFWSSLVNSVKAWPGLIDKWFSDHAFAGIIILAGLSLILFSISSGLSGTTAGDTIKQGVALAAMA